MPKGKFIVQPTLKKDTQISLKEKAYAEIRRRFSLYRVVSQTKVVQQALRLVLHGRLRCSTPAAALGEAAGQRDIVYDAPVGNEVEHLEYEPDMVAAEAVPAAARQPNQ